MYETMSGEHVTLKVVNKISGILKFLYLKNSFLTPGLQRMLCIALMQPHLIMHALKKISRQLAVC